MVSQGQPLFEQAEALLMRMASDQGLPFKTVFDLAALSVELGYQPNHEELQKIFSYFYKSGWVSVDDNSSDRSFKRVILRQSGKDRGIALLMDKGPIGTIERFRRITDRWVGFIALLTLFATIIAAIFSYLSIAD